MPRRYFSDPGKNASWHFVRFLVTELHGKEGEAPKRGLWAVRSTGPPSSPGRLVPRSMTGGSPVDTAVTSPCPLHNVFITRALVCPRTHMGDVTSNGYIKRRLRVRSSHIVNLKADIELRVVG